MTTRILLSLFLTALFASCSTSGKVSADSESQRLTFGSGGGFTGIYTSYELHDDGHVYAIQRDSTLILVNKLRKKKARAIFAEANKLKLAQPVFNHPGNITWFINYLSTNDSIEYKWGDANISVPVEIKDFYSQLNAIVK